MTNQVLEMFERLIERVNDSAEHRDFIREWVGAYQGKVLQLETEKGTFHIVLYRKGKISLKTGAYPSPDVIYKATTKTLMNLFTGQASFRDLTKRWELVIIGAGHESLALGQLILRVLQST
ncbi:MAG: SCP2 sterol-binding domain-containing protein [Candidatus Thorarchaeota archaeon]